MSWYDPTSWFDNGSDQKNDALHDALTKQSQQSSQFGQQLQGGLGGIDQGLAGQMSYLQGLQSGKDSLSSEQLRQGLQQNLAAQQSMAASASPQNATMAARNAAMNMGRLGYGMSGQAAMAGIQERNAASQALMNALLQQRGQNIGGANQAYGTATQGFGMGVANPYQSWAQQNAPWLTATAAGLGALSKSDKRAKKNVDEDDGKGILKALKSYSYDYKDERDGKGRQYGVMAQDMERAGLGHAVINTPAGKVVHGAKAATSALALAAALGKRVEKLEKGKRG